MLVNNRFAQAQPFLPHDVKNFGVTIKKSLAFPLIVISLYSPDGRYDPTFLANYALININDALLRVKGVGDVRNFGSVRLRDADLAQARHAGAPRAHRRRRPDARSAQQNVVNPAGQIGAEPAPPGQQLTYTVRAQGRLVEPEEFGDVVVRENPDGSHGARARRRARRARRAQLPAVRHVQRQAGRGHRRVPDAGLERARGRAKHPRDDGRAHEALPARASRTRSRSTPPRRSTRASRRSSRRWSRPIVARRARRVHLPAELARDADPAADRAGVADRRVRACFPLLGFSVNTLSLFGLVLAIGLVVDDAIVVVEAVEHHIEDGMSPREATLQGDEARCRARSSRSR